MTALSRNALLLTPVRPKSYLSGFFGAARWVLVSPGYGIYVGAGEEWRDLVPGWHLGRDARYAPNLARDDLNPEDPTGKRSWSCGKVVGSAFYLSRGFGIRFVRLDQQGRGGRRQGDEALPRC